MVLFLATLFLGYQASQLRPDAGFAKQLPPGHPYLQVFKQYRKDFGGANLVLFALVQKQGDMYNAEFLNTLQKATDEVFFLPGVDRARVSSLFTPDVRFIEVVEGGFSGGNVVPADYQPTPEMLERVRANVGKSRHVGRLVANDHSGAMIFSELLEFDPLTQKKLDYVRTAYRLEDLRGQFTHPVMYEYRLKEDRGVRKAGDLVLKGYQDVRGKLRFQTFDLRTPGEDGIEVVEEIKGGELDVTEAPNPDYNANVDVHIVGFAKVVGDVSEATLEVVSFFGLTLLITLILLWQYCGSLRIALLPLSCAVLAVVWELGLMHLFGFGLDPFAILVPFLVVSISVSHGVQITSFWLYEIADHGRDSFEGSRATYRRLVIPGLTALLTNVVGFGTILLIPIGIIQEMAINAMFGLVAVIVCKKILLPCLLSYAPLRDPQKFRDHQRRRDALFDPMWKVLSAITGKKAAAAVLAGAVGVLVWSHWMARDLKIGELHAGVPELRPDSRYNRDSVTVTREFAIGVDVLKVMAETQEQGCINHESMALIDSYAWRISNTPGVQSTISLAQIAKLVNAAYNEANPKWRVLSRNSTV
ncbi:MAG: MMPL family transporter, partial [Hydrocarboniphaga effusa]|nr:MMPL family transporter [Hydrocarboniphaga effusa]